jgi:hypothetical protein
MYARPFFLTLRVDNLPEIRKRQYKNKCRRARISTRRHWIWNGTKKKNFCRFFREAKCGAHSDAAQHRKTTRFGWIGERAGGSRGVPRNSRDLPRGGIIELPRFARHRLIKIRLD